MGLSDEERNAIIARLTEENKKSGKPEEILDLVKLFSQEFEYRYRNLWGIIFKSIFAIVTVMAVPYALLTAKHDLLEKFPVVFPIISAGLCFFAKSVYNAEHHRMQKIGIVLNALLESLSKDYQRLYQTFRPERDKTGKPARKWIIGIYYGLFGLSCIELLVLLYLFLCPAARQ